MIQLAADSIQVWLVDPANLTPFYDVALGSALAATGCRVRWVTSHFRLDATIQIPEALEMDEHYFRRIGKLAHVKHDSLRRFARAISYGFDHRHFVRKALRLRPQIVHLQWSRLPVADLWLIKRLRKAGIRVIHTVHDVEPLFANSGGPTALEKVYRSCDRLIVHADANVSHLLDRYRSIRRERVHVIPHGPLQADTTPSGATREKARELLGIPAHVPLALFFGQIKPYKGLDVLLKAFQSVWQQIPQAHLVVAGRLDSSADCLNIAKLRDADPRLIAHLRFLPNEDIWQYYIASDIVVLPYRSITQSGVLLSAMAFGRPAIVTNVGGLPEVIKASQAGWIVEPEDADTLAQVLTTCLADLDSTRTKGAIAKKYVETELAWSRIAERTKELYRGILSDKSEPSSAQSNALF